MRQLTCGFLKSDRYSTWTILAMFQNWLLRFWLIWSWSFTRQKVKSAVKNTLHWITNLITQIRKTLWPITYIHMHARTHTHARTYTHTHTHTHKHTLQFWSILELTSPEVRFIRWITYNNKISLQATLPSIRVSVLHTSAIFASLSTRFVGLKYSRKNNININQRVEMDP